MGIRNIPGLGETSNDGGSFPKSGEGTIPASGCVGFVTNMVLRGRGLDTDPDKVEILPNNLLELNMPYLPVLLSLNLEDAVLVRWNVKHADLFELEFVRDLLLLEGIPYGSLHQSVKIRSWLNVNSTPHQLLIHQRTEERDLQNVPKGQFTGLFGIKHKMPVPFEDLVPGFVSDVMEEKRVCDLIRAIACRMFRAKLASTQNGDVPVFNFAGFKTPTHRMRKRMEQPTRGRYFLGRLSNWSVSIVEQIVLPENKRDIAGDPSTVYIVLEADAMSNQRSVGRVSMGYAIYWKRLKDGTFALGIIQIDGDLSDLKVYIGASVQTARRVRGTQMPRPYGGS